MKLTRQLRICRIDENQAWVTVAEGQVTFAPRIGENNRVILTKITKAP